MCAVFLSVYEDHYWRVDAGDGLLDRGDLIRGGWEGCGGRDAL